MEPKGAEEIYNGYNNGDEEMKGKEPCYEDEMSASAKGEGSARQEEDHDHVEGDYSADDQSEARDEGTDDGPIPVRPGARRNREYKAPIPSDLVDGVNMMEPKKVRIKRFGIDQHYANSTEFMDAWAAYEKDTFTTYISRTSDFVHKENKRREVARVKGKKPIDEAFLNTVIPDHLIHSKIARRCSKGVFIHSRGTGQRVVRIAKWVKCDARITCDATRDPTTKTWTLKTRDEFHEHNNACDESMLETNARSALLDNPEVLAEVSRLIQARAPARNIIDTLAANFNIHVTAKQLANLKRDRLGGHGAIANLKLLLARFAAFPGSHCTLIDDQEGQVCGVVLQSAAQKNAGEVRRQPYPRLDSQHEQPRFLPRLMVTSVSGRGVSVFDFLCLEQTEAMMTTVFSTFMDNNPDAKIRVKSFVIDKVYKEWRVLQRLFPASAVLLCQFHVVKWFAFVVTMKKYDLDVKMREKVLLILYAMVYARTSFNFDMHQAELTDLLLHTCPLFLAYMKARWYNCRHMWSDCESARVFTALNSTSTRIESSWNQVKQILGRNLRIDLCVEAIFAYQTAVMRREYRLINKYAHCLVLRSTSDPFMKPALVGVSEYAAAAANEQWRVYEGHCPSSRDPYVSKLAGVGVNVYQVGRSSPEALQYTVDATASTCTCDFQVTSGLPCRHLIHVNKNLVGVAQYPVDGFNPRWQIRRAFDILSLLKANTKDLQSLRTALLLSDSAFTQIVEHEYKDVGTFIPPVPRKVTYFRLNRAETGSVVVRNNLEKRNTVDSIVPAMKTFLMSQSTPNFLKMASELDEMLTKQLAKWKERVHGVQRQEEFGDAAVVADDDGIDEDGEAALLGFNDVIGSAIAHEESSFYDAENSQVAVGGVLDRRSLFPFPEDRVPNAEHTDEVGATSAKVAVDQTKDTVKDAVYLTFYSPSVSSHGVDDILDAVAAHDYRLPDNRVDDGASVSSLSASSLSTDAVSRIMQSVARSLCAPGREYGNATAVMKKNPEQKQTINNLKVLLNAENDDGQVG